jgi:hypothetical protein
LLPLPFLLVHPRRGSAVVIVFLALKNRRLDHPGNTTANSKPRPISGTGLALIAVLLLLYGNKKLVILTLSAANGEESPYFAFVFAVVPLLHQLQNCLNTEAITPYVDKAAQSAPSSEQH